MASPKSRNAVAGDASNRLASSTTSWTLSISFIKPSRNPIFFLPLPRRAQGVRHGFLYTTRRLAGLGVRATIVVDVHPGEERLIERVQRLNTRALQLGEECGADEAIERFDLAMALRAAFLREDQPVNAERGDDLPHVMGAVDL